MVPFMGTFADSLSERAKNLDFRVLIGYNPCYLWKE